MTNLINFMGEKQKKMSSDDFEFPAEKLRFPEESYSVLVSIQNKLERLSHFHSDMVLPHDIHYILEKELSNFRELVATKACSVFLVNEEQFEFVHKASIPSDLSSALHREIDAQIQPGTFGWVMNSGYCDTLLVVANSIEARDPYTRGHSHRVGQIARLIAEELNWNSKKVEFIGWGGMLHDVGKIGIRDGILNKKGKLETDEYEKMKLHPTIGAQIIEGISFLEPVVPYILEHHERFNGQGYPQGLVGEQISIEGRLLAVADVFDAMTTNRPYHRASEPEAAFRCITAQSGELYDPSIIDAFKKVWSRGNLHEIIPPQKIS